MIVPRSQDALHKTHLIRLLMGILDDQMLARSLFFKGGTCAALVGWLDRFSLDLDFDLSYAGQEWAVSKRLIAVASGLGYLRKQQQGLMFVFGYPSRPGERNSIKVSVFLERVTANVYVPLHLIDIQRYALCQNRETMVANKLVAPLDRFDRYKTIAGRDIYDIHYFLSHGYRFRQEVIRERRGVAPGEYLSELIAFIRQRVTDRVIAEDLNYLLPPKRFQLLRKTLKEETLLLLRDERVRQQS